MRGADRYKLRFGLYAPPKGRRGRFIRDRARGDAKVAGMSDGRIPWPVCIAGGKRSRILCGDLVRAVRRETRLAIMHHWGVGHATVQKWRRVLNVPHENEGTTALRADHFAEPWADRARRKAWSKARDPGRREKIAAARRGKPRPMHVVEAVRKAHLGSKHSTATRQQMSAAHQARGTRPPWIAPAWIAKDDALLATLTPTQVAERTGRSLWAVHQ
jgi:hypothetical protein